jgi:DNA-binding NtrC family response regulator
MNLSALRLEEHRRCSQHRTFENANAFGGFVNSPSVLVVDDDAPVSAVIQEILRSAGYPVSATSSPNEAIEMIRKGDFGVLIYDLSIRSQPESFDLLASCLKDQPGLAILLITGFADDEARQETRELGIRLLEKPFGATDLLCQLSSLLRRIA